MNRAVPGLDIHNSLENTFLPPPTAGKYFNFVYIFFSVCSNKYKFHEKFFFCLFFAASLVGSPPLLDPDSPESKTLAPSFKVHPRGYSGPVIISQVCKYFKLFFSTDIIMMIQEIPFQVLKIITYTVRPRLVWAFVLEISLIK